MVVTVLFGPAAEEKQQLETENLMCRHYNTLDDKLCTAMTPINQVNKSAGTSADNHKKRG
jgi:hypothetical protein